LHVCAILPEDLKRKERISTADMANLPLANIFNRKTRTTVGILAVALGVSTVLVLVGLAEGSLDETARRIQNVGADILFQAPDASTFLALSAGVLPARLESLLRETPGVEEAAPVLVNNITRVKNNNKFVMIFGIDPESYNRLGSGLQIVEGRGLEKPGDLLVDTVLAAADDIKVGDKLSIMSREYEVVGIPRAGGVVLI
jgi:ABC-type lipoprotein release transport system permease subunit